MAASLATLSLAYIPIEKLHLTPSFLRDRHFLVRLGDTRFSVRTPTSGVPQSLTLIPLLFSVFTRVIPKTSNGTRSLCRRHRYRHQISRSKPDDSTSSESRRLVLPMEKREELCIISQQKKEAGGSKYRDFRWRHPLLKKTPST